MRQPEIRNAVISSTTLGWEDHGILTCWVQLDYSGAGQGFGGYALDEPKFEGGNQSGKFLGRFGTDFGMQFVAGILKAVGSESWEKLKGMHCRAYIGSDGRIDRIGHIIKDEWFDPLELSEKFGLNRKGNG